MNLFECHLKLKEKKISAVELVQDSLKNFEKADNNSMISLTYELALKEASWVDREIARNGVKGPLHGIPYTLKDLFITKGIRTTAGSKILYNYIPPYDGYISAQLKKAGAIMMGKVTLDEFGMGSSGEMTPFSVAKNPLNKTKVAGGSSSGSAVSVAEGTCLFSIGTDTGGSVRLPANFCGLVGFRPSYGRVSRYGQIAYASSLDQAGPLAKTVRDLAYVMDAITEKDPRDATNTSLPSLDMSSRVDQIKPSFLKGKRIGFCPALIDDCRRDVKGELQRALSHFKSEGVELVELDFSYLKYAVATYYIISCSEASANLARYDGIHYGLSKRNIGNLEEVYAQSRQEGLGSEVKRRILLGTYSLSSGYYDAYYTKACKIRHLITKEFKENLKKCDAIFFPVSGVTAFSRSEIEEPLKMYLNDLYTIPVNLASLPGLAIPLTELFHH
ncbi:MAG: Asp-tRNA(Asn)/Glu-tRNA(Gln) amidotransferase subunit GatA, partial [Halobacteriovoraceae bacterium]|nr:Asp-tRNA(Asn)/Glu-tRNA(Gln) amidotransferase subunit GatA [Halobacteriovoraceae bacterium]